MQFNRTTPKFDKLVPYFLENYPHTKDEVDPSFPSSFRPVLDATILADSDHTYDLATRRSITWLLDYVGSTHVTWTSKRQGSIASSTYVAEFSALRTATEEA